MFVNHEDARQQTQSADIALEAGGDHQFDLGHLRRQGAVRLIRLLLQAAGYRASVPWRMRVEKKITCGGETRPVTVVGSKPWCCYLKVKPGDNDTGHFCSLLMADGYRGEAVYDALKVVEDKVNQAWRDGAEEILPVDDSEPPAEAEAARHPVAREAAHQLLGPATPADAGPAPGAAEGGGAEAGASELLGWTRDADKVRLTLLAIHELGVEGKATALDVFVTALANKLSWQGLRRKQIGAIFATLMRRGHISKMRRGSARLGYALTAEGRGVIKDLLPPGEAAAAPAAVGPPPALPTDPARLAAALAGIAQEYGTACQKLQENRARRTQLLTEVERLDAEVVEMSRVIDNPEVRGLLQRLIQLTGPNQGDVQAIRAEP